MRPTLTPFTALPKPSAPLRPPLTRREALMAGGAGWRRLCCRDRSAASRTRAAAPTSEPSCRE